MRISVRTHRNVSQIAEDEVDSAGTTVMDLVVAWRENIKDDKGKVELPRLFRGMSQSGIVLNLRTSSLVQA